MFFLLLVVAFRLQFPLQDKNFYALSLMQRTKPAAAEIARDAELERLLEAKREALHKAATTCQSDVACFTAPMRWSDAEVETAASALRREYAKSAAVRDVAGALRRSRVYVRYDAKPGDELLAAAWLDAARGINHVIDVYGSGNPPRYPAIDAISFDVTSEAYLHLLHTVAASLDEEKSVLFFEPSLRLALELLRVNNRDEAARHEPLDQANAAAIRHLATIAWKKYPYSAIVLLGAGPERPGVSLSAEGRVRAEIAARRFKEGKAPLIIASGGYVHPNQTPYCEAVEMKKALVADYGVPAEAILIEPHARHTTTNLRNAARLMVRYGIPLEKKALVTTDSYHSAYVESEGFAKRCEQELGYQPVTLLGRVSPFDLAFTPRVESLQIDPMDPLDP